MNEVSSSRDPELLTLLYKSVVCVVLYIVTLFSEHQLWKRISFYLQDNVIFFIVIVEIICFKCFKWYLRIADGIPHLCWWKLSPYDAFPVVTIWVSPGPVQTRRWLFLLTAVRLQSCQWKAGCGVASGRPSAVLKAKASKALCSARFYLMGDYLQETSTVMSEKV